MTCFGRNYRWYCLFISRFSSETALTSDDTFIFGSDLKKVKSTPSPDPRCWCKMALITGGGFDGSRSLIPLACDEGQRLLEESDHTNLVFHYCKQVNRTYCGLRSIAICMNGLLEDVDAQEGLEQYNQFPRLSKMKLDFGSIGEEDVLLLGGKEAELDMEELKVDGMTLATLGKLCSVLGLQSSIFYAMTKETNACSDVSIQKVGTLDEFRSTVLASLQNDDQFVVVNYSLSALGYVLLRGHFSPIGGYNPKQDRFLVLDVWPDTPAVWVKSGDLFDAMKDVDRSSGMPRGFCVLGFSS